MHETIRNRVMIAGQRKSPWQKGQRLRGLEWSRPGSNRRPLECDSSYFFCAAKVSEQLESCKRDARLRWRGFGAHDEIRAAPGACTVVRQ